MLDVKAEEMSGTGMVMVHDLLVLTNDFLADKDRVGKKREAQKGSDQSLFQKMMTEEQRQREQRVRPRAVVRLIVLGTIVWRNLGRSTMDSTGWVSPYPFPTWGTNSL